MKKTGLLLIIALFSWLGYAQDTDSTGLEGDHLDLNGVLELFKESENVEDFEKKLNTEDNGVNNLDLNEDGEVDYIRVIDHANGDAHALALQVPVDESESQDVAVIEIEQSDDEEIKLQVIGDSELYGEDYMVEPVDQKNRNVTVNVYGWRPVRHIYGPRYTVWVSPWRWRQSPRWWRPWRRVHYRVYRPRVVRYHRPYYRRVHVRRCHRAHRHYTVHHVHSVTFKKNHSHKHVVTKSNHTKPKTARNSGPTKSTAKTTSSPKRTRSTSKSGKTSQQHKAAANKSGSKKSSGQRSESIALIRFYTIQSTTSKQISNAC